MAGRTRATVVKADEMSREELDNIVEGIHVINQQKREPTQQEKTQAALRHVLSELGKTLVQEDELLFEGTKFILPAQYNGRVPEAINFLASWQKNQAKRHDFSRTFQFRPYDVGYAFLETMKELTGTKGLGVSKFTFFGEEPPQFVSINVGPNQTTQIPWGQVAFPMFDATFELSASRHRDFGLVGHIICSAPKRNQSIIEAIFHKVEDYLKQYSLYRGKAIYGDEMNPEFIDTRKVDRNKVVYSDNVIRQLEANIWGPIRFTQNYRDQRVSLKRAVLFAGPFGTGKTLGCMLTAQEAEANGWTYIQCRVGEDPAVTLKTAQLYAPAVVVVEDFDANTEATNAVEISRLLEMLDGATNKGQEIIGVFTTNYLEKIQKGALRPGRIDAIIEIDGLDAAAFQKLISVTLGDEWLEKKIDWDAVAVAFEGFLPAFVKEGAERAQRYSMARNGGKPTVIGTQDLVDAADSLRPQLERMLGAKEGVRPVTIDDRVQTLVDGALNRTSLPGYGAFEVVEPTIRNGAKSSS